MALASVTGPISSLGKAAAKSGLYSAIDEIRSIIGSGGRFITGGRFIASNAWSSRFGEKPSHMKAAPQARLRIVGERRPSFAMPWPTPTGRPSPQPRPGLLQLAQD